MRRIGTGTADIHAVDIARVTTALQRGRLSAGPYMDDFERAFAEMHGSAFATMCNSGTGALQLALQALKEKYGWPDGAEVIVPAMTFVATVNVVLFNRLTPVLVDVDPLTYTMDPTALAAAVTDRTVAAIPVHLYGQPADMSKIMEIAHRDGLVIVEDACETAGVAHYGRPVGSFGEYGCFSTYMAHIVTTGVGGVAVTSDPENATRFRSLMNHGRDPRYIRIDDDENVSDDALLDIVAARYRFVSIGQSFRVTEMEAALGIGQVKRLPAVLKKRRQVASWLTAELTDLPLQLPTVGPGNEHAYMMYPIVCHDGRRDEYVVALERAGVETRPLMPIIDQPCYEGIVEQGPLPITRRLLVDGFFIGCHQGMTRDDAAYIGEVMHAA